MWRRMLTTTLGLTVASLDRAQDGLGDLRRVAAYTRGRLALRPRPDDLYVATYPRSGTTWMTYMLHLLLRGADAPFEHINDACPWIERSLARGIVDATELNALPSPRIFKTHLLPRWLPSGGTRIYIERDPGDVAASYFRLYRDYLGFTGTAAQFVERFERGQVQYGAWWTHVARWREHARAGAVVWLRYEELLADPAAGLRTIAEAAGLRVTDEAIEAAVAGASLSAMKALEGRFDHATALLRERGVKPGQFIGARHGGVDEHEKQRLRTASGPAQADRTGLAAFLH